MPHQTAVAELEIADIYAELNLFSDAEELYRPALTTLRRLKLKAEEARGRMNLGKAVLSLGKISAGRKELSKAAFLFAAERNEVGISSVKLVQARLEISAGSPDKALTLADESAARLRRSDNRRHYLSALWLRGASLAAIGRRTAARQIFRRTLIRQPEPAEIP